MVVWRWLEEARLLYSTGSKQRCKWSGAVAALWRARLCTRSHPVWSAFAWRVHPAAVQVCRYLNKRSLCDHTATVRETSHTEAVFINRNSSAATWPSWVLQAVPLSSYIAEQRCCTRDLPPPHERLRHLSEGLLCLSGTYSCFSSEEAVMEVWWDDATANAFGQRAMPMWKQLWRQPYLWICISQPLAFLRTLTWHWLAPSSRESLSYRAPSGIRLICYPFKQISNFILKRGFWAGMNTSHFLDMEPGFPWELPMRLNPRKMRSAVKEK